ncbi:MAG: hypothetical protein GXO58_08580 [Thermodesulfobacteria bacterium]|nr:hypothetical protein [Thermodesulfobacteriota bacterium]
MADLNLSTLTDNNIVLGSRDFLVAAQNELARLKRYGGQSTFLLIKPHANSNGSKGDYTTSIYHSIKDRLRHCDGVYLLDKDHIVAILPNTHEAGGETASFRLKKEVSRIKGPNNEQIPMSVGVVCVWHDRCDNVAELLDELYQDLERDEKCQILPQKGARRDETTIVLLTEIAKKEGIKRLLGSEFKIIDENLDPESPTKIDLLLVDEEHLEEKGQEIEKLRNHHGLNHKIEIRYENSSLVLFSSAKTSIEQLMASACLGFVFDRNRSRGANKEKKFKDALSAIGSATHQLNQPLQIIMGKIELLLLDLSMDEDLPKEKLKTALEQVKEQVHYASEINAKINRLTKL